MHGRGVPGSIDPAYPLVHDHPLNRGLIAWFRVMPGRSAGNRWYDLVRGTFGGMESYGTGSIFKPTTRQGGSGELVLDGVGGSVTIDNSPIYRLDAGYTVACWVRFAVPTTAIQTIIFKALDADPFTGFHLFKTNYGDFPHSLEFKAYHYVPVTNLNIAVIDDGSWHHVVGRMAAALMSMTTWVDGVSSAPGGGGIGAQSNAADLIIGDGVGSWSCAPMAGAVDDVRLWDRPLTDSEIAAVIESSRRGEPETLRRIGRTVYSAASAAPTFNPAWAVVCAHADPI